jgi:hypothetical protein
MSASQVYVASGAAAAVGANPSLLNIRGQNASIVLLACAEAQSAQGGQPANTTLTFVVPGSVATDIPFFSKSASATAASQIDTCVLTNAGAANATYTLTLGAAEAFTAALVVYRLV